MSADTPRRLGRGLEALISTARSQHDTAPPTDASYSTPGTELRTVPVLDIVPNRFQPRRTFTETELAELEASIKASGLLQPITVRPREGGGWELVAGERRLRASTRLGWTEIPAIVRDFDDRAMLTLALVENLQRSDLNALEEAAGYQQLIQEFALTQQQVAEAVGKDRTTITNLLRVLSLPPAVQTMVAQSQITAGHARALLVVKDAKRQIELANEIIAHQLSVRDVESRARGIGRETGTRNKPPKVAGKAGGTGGATAVIRRVEEQLRRRLQTDVSVQPTGKGRGVIHISFFSDDDLERVLDIVIGQLRSDFD